MRPILRGCLEIYIMGANGSNEPQKSRGYPALIKYRLMFDFAGAL